MMMISLMLVFVQQGNKDTIYEPYQNLALRTVEGTDIAIYYDFETSIGDFSVALQSSITDKFEQEPSAQFSAIAAAVTDGTLPPYISLEGYGDLKNNENIGTDQKDTLQKLTIDVETGVRHFQH